MKRGIKLGCRGGSLLFSNISVFGQDAGMPSRTHRLGTLNVASTKFNWISGQPRVVGP